MTDKKRCRRCDALCYACAQGHCELCCPLMDWHKRDRPLTAEERLEDEAERRSEEAMERAILGWPDGTEWDEH